MKSFIQEEGYKPSHNEGEEEGKEVKELTSQQLFNRYRDMFPLLAELVSSSGEVSEKIASFENRVEDYLTSVKDLDLRHSELTKDDRAEDREWLKEINPMLAELNTKFNEKVAELVEESLANLESEEDPTKKAWRVDFAKKNLAIFDGVKQDKKVWAREQIEKAG